MWPQSIWPSHMAVKREILAQIKNLGVTPASAPPTPALPAPTPLCFSCTVFVVCLHPTPYISWCVLLKEAKASLSLLFTQSSSGLASMRSLHCTADEIYSTGEVHWQRSTTEFSVGVGTLLMAFFIQDCDFSMGPTWLPAWRLYELLYIFTVLKILGWAEQLILKGIYQFPRRCCCCYGLLGPSQMDRHNPSHLRFISYKSEVNIHKLPFKKIQFAYFIYIQRNFRIKYKFLRLNSKICPNF